MKEFIIVLGLAAHAIAAAPPPFQCPKSLKRDGCLTNAQAESILSRWPIIYDGVYGGKQLQTLIDCTVTEDFTAYDRTFTFGGGGNGQLTANRSAFIASQQQEYDIFTEAPQYSATAKGGRYSQVFFFHSCNQIAWRWMFEGKTSGKHKCTHTNNTKAGIPINYYGVDLLFIKEGTIQIEKVVTSADWINNFLPIGADFNGSPICPGTVPTPPDPACGG